MLLYILQAATSTWGEKLVRNNSTAVYIYFEVFENSFWAILLFATMPNVTLMIADFAIPSTIGRILYAQETCFSRYCATVGIFGAFYP